MVILNEPHLVARLQEAHGRVRGVEEFQRSVADKLPAAGRGDRVNARLIPGDAKAAGGDFFTRRRKPGCMQRGRKPCQIGESGNKPEEGNRVFAGGVEFDDFFLRKAVEVGDTFQIGTAIVNRNFVVLMGFWSRR